MIDEKKYEGHTKGAWAAQETCGECDETGTCKEGCEYNNWSIQAGKWMDEDVASALTRIDARLIADAPDLLEEVKRMADKLRAEEDTHDLIEGKLREQVVELKEDAKQLREGIKLILSEETAYDLEVFERKLMELIE